MTPSAHQLPVSVAVITLNEEANLGRCLGSVADIVREIVVVDSGSSDQTVTIARSYGAHVEVREWSGFANQKNHAIALCSQPWVLSLDADECLSPELRAALADLFATTEPAAAAYAVCRRTEYLGAWIWHAWYPEWRPRLFRRDRARWQGLDPHERLVVDGASARLSGGDLLHYTYRDLDHHMRQTLHYARLGAARLAAEGKPFKGRQLLLSPLGRLLRMLIIRQAWRDGWRGLIIAGSSSLAAFLKYAYLYEMTRTRKKD